MKLLLDQQLPSSLIEKISDIFPESKHVKWIELNQADDLEIWEYSKKNGFTIVTKDNDFNEISILYGAPPKIIWIKVGNCTNVELVSIFLKHTKDILAFGDDKENTIYTIEKY